MTPVRGHWRSRRLPEAFLLYRSHGRIKPWPRCNPAVFCASWSLTTDGSHLLAPRLNLSNSLGEQECQLPSISRLRAHGDDRMQGPSHRVSSTAGSARKKRIPLSLERLSKDCRGTHSRGCPLRAYKHSRELGRTASPVDVGRRLW